MAGHTLGFGVADRLVMVRLSGKNPIEPGSKGPDTRHMEPLSEPPTGKVVALDPTVVGYRQVWMYLTGE